MKKTADDYVFNVEEVEEKIKFRSMVVPDKILENDNIQEDKV
jgi:hypothetical protein